MQERGQTHDANTQPVSRRSRAPGRRQRRRLDLPPQHLATHGIVLGMTGSGKTGLLMVMVEEALRAGVPVIMIDVKGDLPNLLLSFPTFAAADFTPWLEGYSPGAPEDPAAALAAQLASERSRQLQSWRVSEDDLKASRARSQLRVLTPGSSAGESLHILSSLERHSAAWSRDPDAGRAALSAAISLVLRLLGKDPDPAKSREHVLLAVLAERRLEQGHTAELGSLLDEVLHPPIQHIGALPVNDFLPPKERKSFAAALNTLLASPSFASWRQGASLDVRDWLTARDGRTPAVIVSIAHLDDDERALVLGVLLEEILAYTRSLPGSRNLRTRLVFDEVYGMLPPHPLNPPTKRPTVALMKQGRAFGVGVLLSTQNPIISPADCSRAGCPPRINPAQCSLLERIRDGESLIENFNISMLLGGRRMSGQWERSPPLLPPKTCPLRHRWLPTHGSREAQIRCEALLSWALERTGRARAARELGGASTATSHVSIITRRVALLNSDCFWFSSTR